MNAVRYSKDGSVTSTVTQAQMQLNMAHNYWRNPGANARKQRLSGFFSTSSPVGTLHHEIGHLKDKKLSLPGYARNWVALYAGKQDQMQQLARRVSRYAATSPAEFIAETYAGLRTGRKYDREVMQAYREAMGLSSKPPARMRSRLPRRRKPKA